MMWINRSRIALLVAAATGVAFTVVAQVGVPSQATVRVNSDAPRVLDAQGQPVSGARVTVFPSPTRSQVRSLKPGQSVSFKAAYTTKTDSAGRYVIPAIALPQGSHDFTISVQKSGFTSASTFSDKVSGLSDKVSGTSTRSRSAAPVSPREEVLTLQRSSTGASIRTASAPSPLSSVQSSNINYRKISDRNTWAKLTKLYSRTTRAAISFDFESGGSSSLGWGIMTPGDIAFHGGGTRAMSASAGIPFTAWSGQTGTRALATRVYYVRWEITKTWFDCQRNGCTRHDYTWQETRPEGFNGGEKRFASKSVPRITHREWCGGPIRKGNSNWVSNGVADTLDYGVNAYGVWLSAQAGFNSTVKTRFTAKSGPIKVCGLKGPALSASGFPVAVPA